ncbi:hypothetical protein PAAG_02408 [Paracoccidioides lutzii Pb01]|uniref:Uncharacterized protein n=1 Tax=Paracoccidioides lutzii (strain ATCC MYA-826 / Pb01) TaxID=502779 RepID=C1GUT5_PARBA|nr:hypothetical protein PAAG_02408 [Paracoccidioides lutzii Pb01]EEH40352.2 hypothetical protein PAAG_02408 [Paracoccidioides lutzii Pb01]
MTIRANSTPHTRRVVTLTPGFLPLWSINDGESSVSGIGNCHNSRPTRLENTIKFGRLAISVGGMPVPCFERSNAIPGQQQTVTEQLRWDPALISVAIKLTLRYIKEGFVLKILGQLLDPRATDHSDTAQSLNSAYFV